MGFIMSDSETTSLPHRAARGLLAALRSSKLAVGVLVLLAAISIVGTLIPQNAAPERYLKLFGPTGAGLVARLGLGAIFGAWWFLALVGWLAVSMVVCSLTRLPALLRAVRRTGPWPDEIGGPCERRLVLPGLDETRAAQATAEVLTARHYRVQPSQPAAEGGVFLLAEKGRLGRFGPLLVHLSLVILIFGGAVTVLLGTDYMVEIPVGSTAPLPGTDYQLKMNDFTIRYYRGTHNPEEYISWVTLLDRRLIIHALDLRKDRKQAFQPVNSGEITVNHPLSMGGFQFFQMRYNAEVKAVTISATRSGDEELIGDYRLPIGRAVDVPALGGSLEAAQFFPDFRLTTDRVPVTYSQEFNNPAVTLIFTRSNLPPSKQYLFGMGGSHAPAGAEFIFALKDYKPTYTSGLKVVRNPGSPVICFGLALLVAATFLSCYVSHRRIRATVRRSPDGAELVLTGLYSRQPLDFARELERCLAAIAERGGRKSA